MSKALAALNDVPFFEVSPESIKSAEDLAQIFSKFSPEGYELATGVKTSSIKPPILFIDEAHRLSLKGEEVLGIAMENWRLTFSQGRGAKKKQATAWVPEFTLVCATTKEGELSKPFRDRFKFIFIFNRYSLDEAKQIIKLHADKLDILIDDKSVEEIAKRGRGTPRLLVRYLDNMRDSMLVLNRDRITSDLVEAQFKLMSIDPVGLTKVDRKILLELYNSEYPKGLDSLAVTTSLDPKTIVDVNEPFLILLGFIERTKGGRVITEKGKKHLSSLGLIEEEAEETNHISRILKA